jgi:limonene-1,2-epoxide hydrolase
MAAMLRFMQGYKRAWEGRDDDLLAGLFAPDGVYHNTPFDAQRGHAAIRKYWDRVKLQADIALDFDIVADGERAGVAHWHVTYQVTSEKMFAMWAAAAGTGLPARNPGDPLPRMELDGVALADFDAAGLCTRYRIWWHSRVAG